MQKTKSKNKSATSKPEQSTIQLEVKRATKEAKKIGKKVVAKLKNVKDRFDALEPKRKKEILAGIIGATTVAVGIGAGLAKKNKKKNN